MIDSLVAEPVETGLALPCVSDNAPKRIRPKDGRITLLFSDKIWDWIEEGMSEEGFTDNVSQFLAHLVRMNRQQRQRGALSLHERAGTYSQPAPSSASETDTQHKISEALRRELPKPGSASPSSAKRKR